MALIVEFCVDGPPVSAQTRNRRNLGKWRQKVAHAALGARPTGSLVYGGDVDVTITYFCERRWRGDNDNMMKPIRDALEGIVYRNDRQIKEDRFRYRDLNGRFRVRGMSLVLAHAFVRGTEFLHIKIEESPSVEEIG